MSPSLKSSLKPSLKPLFTPSLEPSLAASLAPSLAVLPSRARCSALSRLPAALAAAALVGVLLTLTGCGGGGSESPAAGPAAVAASAASAASVDGTAAALAASVQLQPTYHLSPVLPGDPGEVDRDGHSASAHLQPRSVPIPVSRRGVSTRALTVQDLSDDSMRARVLGASSTSTSTSTGAGNGTGSGTDSTATGTSAAPQATTATSVTYTPAQIRAAYGLPPVPTSLAALTPMQAAQLGAGQTIYVVDAFHDAYAFGELQAFSSQFGLPGCTQKTLLPTSSLPLPAPSTTATSCEFYQVGSSAGGTVANAFPRYDAQWATEIALDVQWAHAIAPLARIVLIEASDASLTALGSAVQLANRMGPGVVSMSFGAAEGSYVSGYENLFQASGMTYFAATGDNGAAVNWPAASPSVVAVGGTSLRYSGTGPRTETAWSLAGGGISAYIALPSYQNATLLRTTAVTRRAVADVSMNADPTTGQYVAVIPNQTTCTFCQVSWVTTGGTSLSTPQWAGFAAVANATRAQAGKGPMGAPHAVLYQSLATSATYAGAFLDITQGSNGSCVICAAKAGYDAPTGLGTPNGLTLVNLLANGSTAPAAPVPPTVAAATVNGAYGVALSVTPSVAGINPYTLSLSGAPAGMAVSGSVITWPSPVTGSFSVTVTARDSKTGLSGSGLYTVVIAPPPPPIVSSGSLTATVGQALSLPVSAGDRYPVRLSLVGAPAGMSLTSTGTNAALLNWPAPQAGTYRFTLRADTAQTGLSAQGSYTLVVNPAGAPRVASGQIAIATGSAWSSAVSVVAANPYTLALSGAPAGLTLSAGGVLSWSSPVAGSYALTVSARDAKTGLVGSAVINLKVDRSTGPAVSSTAFAGVAGKPLSGTIYITDVGASLTGLALASNQAGIKFSPAIGMATTAVTWAAPVTGSFAIQVSVTDVAGRSTMATIPVVINAK